MNLVISLRGWSGSGKSTIILKLLNHFRKATCYDKEGKCIGYCIKTAPLKTFVVGKYTETGGGCDLIHPVGKIEEIIRGFSKRGNVIFEGQMISTIAGRWIELANSIPECRFIFLVLDTPLERCLTRIKKRREQKGNFKPFSPKPSNLRHYQEARFSSPENLRKGGMEVHVVKHKQAYEYILRLLGEE